MVSLVLQELRKDQKGVKECHEVGHFGESWSVSGDCQPDKPFVPDKQI